MKLVDGVYSCTVHSKFAYLSSYNSQDYSDPFVSCLSHPVSDITLRVTKHSITFVLKEQVQVACDFNNSGNPVRPSDQSMCDHVAKSTNTMIFGLGDDTEYKCSFSESCGGISCYQTPRGVAPGGVVRTGTKADDPYAPWRIKHTKTITLSLDKMASAAGLTTDKLIFNILYKRLSYVAITSTGTKANFPDGVLLVDPCYITTALWLATGHTREEALNARSELYEEFNYQYIHAKSEYSKGAEEEKQNNSESAQLFSNSCEYYYNIMGLCGYYGYTPKDIFGTDFWPSYYDALDAMFRTKVKYGSMSFDNAYSQLEASTSKGTVFNEDTNYAFDGAICGSSDLNNILSFLNLMHKAKLAQKKADGGVTESNRNKLNYSRSTIEHVIKCMYKQSRTKYKTFKNVSVDVNGHDKLFNYIDVMDYVTYVQSTFPMDGQTHSWCYNTYSPHDYDKCSMYVLDIVQWYSNPHDVVAICNDLIRHLYRGNLSEEQKVSILAPAWKQYIEDGDEELGLKLKEKANAK